jgi:hypothetical protein
VSRFARSSLAGNNANISVSDRNNLVEGGDE